MLWRAERKRKHNNANTSFLNKRLKNRFRKKRVTLKKTIYICWVFKMVEWEGKLSKLIQE